MTGQPAQRGRPLIVAMIGLPGAGKTAVAIGLSRGLGLRYVCRDRIRAELFPECAFTEAEKLAATDAVWTAVAAHARRGEPCVVDGMTFSRGAERDRLRRVVRESGARLLAIVLDCPVEVAVTRVERDREQRRHPAADRDAALVRRVASRFERADPDWVRVDGSQSAEHVFATCRDLVRRAIAPNDAGGHLLQ